MKTLDLVNILRTLENNPKRSAQPSNRTREHLCNKLRLELTLRANAARTLVNRIH